TIRDSDGLDVAAWHADLDPDAALIILAHGNRSDRRSLIGRAAMLTRAGYAVLLLDLRAHGESPGAHRSFGYGEARSIVAAIGYVRSRWPSRKVGLIGISLGGASAIVAARQARADAYVLEAVYSDLRTAAQNRFAKRLGELGRVVADLVLLQVPWRLGFYLDELSMTARIPEIKAPVLMIAGDRDRRTTVDDTRALFAAAEEPKTLWMIPGARHEDFHARQPREYERSVLSFFRTSLGQ
ncbi:MAG: alpha/beta fold hydrolase, partial [Pseudomonadota bacterium]